VKSSGVARTFKAALDGVRYICKVSDGTGEVGLRDFLIPCFGSKVVYGNEEIIPKPCMFLYF
jgi:hypothetical protein